MHLIDLDTMHDADPDPCSYPGCDGGWILDRDEYYAPCPRCEAEADAMQADHDAEIDAMYGYWADCAALEARERADETAGVPW